MKKLLYIFSFVMLACSCTQEIAEVDTNPYAGKVAIDFNIQLNGPSVATKAMADDPQLKNLMLAVFDETGYLVEYTWAINEGTVYATENGTRYPYKAYLTQSKTPRIIHFIGNAPQDLKFGTEEAVMASLSSDLGSENEDMYWYRKEIPAIEGTSSGGAMALAEGDDSGPILQATPQTLAHMNDIPLIRNFAKIVLTSSSADFTLESYFVVGTPKTGMAAAYNYSTGAFVDYFNYKDSDNADLLAAGIKVVGDPKTYQYLTATEKYDANVPANSSSVTLAEASQKSVAGGASYFVYEREKPLSADAAAYIIACGTYLGDGEKYYYKIDLRDKDGYFPILRNFQYNVDITTVSRAGYNSVEEAAKSTGSGDISSSMETLSLAYISDGVASLEVDYTEMYLISDDPVYLGFTFLPDVNDEDGYGSVSDIWIKVNEPGSTGAAIAAINGNSYTVGQEIKPQENPGVITIKPTTPADTPKTQTLTIYAKYRNGDVEHILQRTVKYIVQTKREMIVALNPYEVPKEMGSEFDLTIKIPGGLSASIFPLQFAIEAEQLTINPANGDHMPVQTGTSITGANKSAFYFVKTLSRDEYLTDQENTVFCNFKTNRAISASDIYVVNEYFTTKYIDKAGVSNYSSVYLDNYDAEKFSNLKFSKDPVACVEGVEVDFTFDMSSVPTDHKVRVSFGGLQLADESHPDFKYLGIENGYAVYEYTTGTSTDVTFNLVTADVDSELYVGLEAYHFVPNEETAKRDWMSFTNLTINPTRLLQGIGRTASISFRMDTGDADYANRNVTVTLDGLEFADGKTEFTFKPVTSGNVTVSVNNNVRTVTINGLKTTTATETVWFTVSAPGYEETSASRTRVRGTFSNLSFRQNNTTVTSLPTTSEEVDFNFTLSEHDENMEIMVTLEGFESADDNLITTKAGGEYIYKPSGENCSFKLRTVDVSQETQCKVTLSEPYFTEASATIKQSNKIVIESGKLVVNFNRNTATFANGGTISIYTSRTGGTLLAEYKYNRSNSSRRATNNADIEITGVTGDTTIYVRYKVNQTTYYASFTLNDATDADGASLTLTASN